MFFIWVFLDIIFWATNRSDEIMFAWAAIILIELLVYAGAVYMTHSFITKQDLSLKKKLLLGLGLLPAIVLLPTKFNLSGFDITTCLSVEGPLALYYSYAFEIAAVIWILVFGILQIRKIPGKKKREAAYFITGTILFLITFSSGNIIGSFTDNWEAAQWGLFGMPILIAFLGYIIVRFKSFNVKAFGAQMLVIALWILVASLLLIKSIDSIRVVIFVTLAMAFFSGIALIRSVRREIEQRERLEEVTKALGDANAKLKKADQLKSEFLSFASHDLKSPVAKMKQWASLVRDKTITDNDKILETAIKIEHTGDNALRLVEEFLNIRKIEEGRMEYNLEELDFVDFVKGTKESFEPIAEEKGLELQFESSAKKLPLKIDQIKMRQVIENLLENSLKYTESGSIKIALEEEEKSVLLKIEDTGLGISKDIIHTLFEQFHRAPGEAKKIKGTGLGLYIAKQIVKAHHGEIWAESDGEGKGSRFYVRIPK
ncbi:MAG: HAMP domain-containing sensor histidine kinase [bacterium]|nr:HAMP domain-containing sensor histidine kinase [bacterium]